MAKVTTNSTQATATRMLGTSQNVVRSASHRQLGNFRRPSHSRCASASALEDSPPIIEGLLHRAAHRSRERSPGREDMAESGPARSDGVAVEQDEKQSLGAASWSPTSLPGTPQGKA